MHQEKILAEYITYKELRFNAYKYLLQIYDKKTTQ